MASVIDQFLVHEIAKQARTVFSLSACKLLIARCLLPVIHNVKYTCGMSRRGWKGESSWVFHSTRVTGVAWEMNSVGHNLNLIRGSLVSSLRRNVGLMGIAFRDQSFPCEAALPPVRSLWASSMALEFV